VERPDVREQAAVLALVSATKREWHRTAAMIEELGSALRFLRREWSGFESFDVAGAEELARRVPAGAVDRYEHLIHTLATSGVTTTTVLDDDYPTNLRAIYNLPPMLFVKGHLSPSDEKAVAVVGTRSPSVPDSRRARQWAGELAARGITVFSGLARGIDSAAHRGALEAGGRTVAVMGTGIERVYPPENASLAMRIEERGALVSQFWPGAPPRASNFPLRNVVMSGMSLGTLVIEAGERSGAKMQARLALDHAKRVLLAESLVRQHDWAKRYATRSGVAVVRSADEVADLIGQLVRPPEQLTLA